MRNKTNKRRNHLTLFKHYEHCPIIFPLNFTKSIRSVEIWFGSFRLLIHLSLQTTTISALFYLALLLCSFTLSLTFSNQVSEPLDAAIVQEIDQKIDFGKLEDVLMAEGIRKFANPQEMLLDQISEKRGSLAAR